MENQKTVFIAGATGAIGKQLCKILVEEGWSVVGTTRKKEKAAMLTEMGVTPVVVDVFDAQALTEAVTAANPAVVIHQLTDLPYGLDPEQMEAALVRNAHLREVGTRNLVEASVQAGASRMIAQSIAFVYEPGEMPFTEESPLLHFDEPAYGETAKAVNCLEQQVINAPLDGLVLRYGLLYGEGTGFATPIPGFPPVHVEAAAKAAALAITNGTTGIYNITEETGAVDSTKARTQLAWNAAFRLA